jgi:hypothetical protein
MKLLAWLAANALYLLGDGVSKLMRLSLFSPLYPLYCWLMLKSLRINDRYGLHVWKPAKSLWVR